MTAYALGLDVLGGLEHPPTLAVLRQRVGHHDLLVVRARANRVTTNRLASGRPVALQFGTRRRPAKWHGYILSTTVLEESTRVKQLEITCLGGSFWMNQARRRAWYDTTVSEVVRAVALEHRLRPVVSSLPRIRPQITQSETDWGLLRRLADEEGCTLFCHNTDLYFLDPAKPSYSAPGTPVLKVKKIRLDAGSESPFGERNRSVSSSAIEWRTGTPLEATGEVGVVNALPNAGDAIFADSLGVPAQDFGEVAAALAASGRKQLLGDRVAVEAEGDSRVRPAVPVSVPSPGFTGTWHTRTVEHHMTPHSHSMSVKALRTRREVPLSEQRARAPEVRLVKGRWVSQRAS